MIKQYMVVCYAILVRNGKGTLEDEEGKIKVPEEYKLAVAEYIVGQN